MGSYEEDLQSLRTSAPLRQPPTGAPATASGSYEEDLMRLKDEFSGAAVEAGGKIKSLIQREQDKLAGREPGIDYTLGLQNVKTGRQRLDLRWDSSAMDTDEEKTKFWDATAGKGNWGRDPSGNIILSTKAADKLGIRHKGQPIAIDPHRLEMGDLAELPVGPILGGLAAGVATGGAGLLPGLLAAGAGTFVGSVAPEALEATGRTSPFQVDPNEGVTQQESLGEIAKRGGEEAAWGMAGEGAVRALAPLASKVISPYTRRKFEPFSLNRSAPYNKIPEARRNVTREVLEDGMRPRVSAVSEGPLVSRYAGMAENIFGDPWAEKNISIVGRKMAQLQGRAGGQAGDAYTVGELVQDTLKRKQSGLYAWAKDRYAKFGELSRAAGLPEDVVRLDNVQRVAKEIIESSPKKVVDGKRVPSAQLGPEGQALRDNILDLAKTQTPEEALELWNKVQSAASDPNAFPGVSKRSARKLKDALAKDFDNLDNVLALQPSGPGKFLRETREMYKNKIEPLKDAKLRGLFRPGDQAGSETVDDFMRRAVTGKSTARLGAMKKALGEDSPEWRDVKAHFMGKLIDEAWVKGSDSFDVTLSGPSFFNAISRYTPKQLEDVFGEETAKELIKTSQKVSFITQKMKAQSGGLVAANIALNPLQNLTRLSKLYILGRVFQSKPFLEWLTYDTSKPGAMTVRDLAGLMSRSVAQVMAQNESLPGEKPPLNLADPEEGQ